MEFKEELKSVFANYDISVTDEQCSLFEEYYKLIKEWNEKFNLTTILEQHDVIIKHFLDSVLIINDLKENAKVIDIGAGAGFPSVPIKIIICNISGTYCLKSFSINALIVLACISTPNIFEL